MVMLVPLQEDLRGTGIEARNKELVRGQ
jgi:hypothetical protein